MDQRQWAMPPSGRRKVFPFSNDMSEFLTCRVDFWMALPEMQFSISLTNHLLLPNSRIWLERTAARSNRINGIDCIWKNNFKRLLIIILYHALAQLPAGQILHEKVAGRAPAQCQVGLFNGGIGMRAPLRITSYYHPRMLDSTWILIRDHSGCRMAVSGRT